MADKDLVGVGACFDKGPDNDKVRFSRRKFAFLLWADLLKTHSTTINAAPVSCSNSGASNDKKSVGPTTDHGGKCSLHGNASQQSAMDGSAGTIDLVIRKRGDSKKHKSGN
jgi:hypothetical protein